MNWLARIFRRGNLYRDLAEEMREHIDEKQNNSFAKAWAAKRRSMLRVVLSAMRR